MKFTVKSRKSLIVYVKSLKHVKILSHYGSITYISNRMHYVIMYLDEKSFEGLRKRINHLGFVKRTLFSPYKTLFNSFYNQEQKDEDDESN